MAAILAPKATDIYKYELNDGTEIHNTALPSTTSCPYLPGQPVNVLNVPVQINPLRERSASEGAISLGIHTMNPADKFLAPRAPPPTPRPQLPRLNTSPTLLDRKSSIRSASENGSRSPWSARSLFGLKGAISAFPGSQDRGRLATSVSRDVREITIKSMVPSVTSSVVVASPIEGKSYKSILEAAAMPGTMSSQEAKLHPIRKPISRDPSPLRHATVPENITNSVALIIPDEIAEEEFEDDDANFANPADLERSLATRLSPPPRRPHHLRTGSSDIKPLPKLPEEQSPAPVAESPSMVPAPLHLAHNASPPNALVARSHFSIDTISTELVSPTESHFSSGPSIYDSNDEEDGVPDDSFTFHSASRNASPPSGLANGFQYSLPVGDMSSESTLKRGDASGLGLSGNGKVTLRHTFGPGSFEAPEKGAGDAVSGLDQLLAEMGFLGDVIVGKEV